MWSLEELGEIRRGRMGPGEYHNPTGRPGDSSLAHARAMFCAALRECTPEVADALKRDVLPHYGALCNQARRAGRETEDRWFNVDWLLDDEGWVRRHPPGTTVSRWQAFRSAFLGWADQFRLNADRFVGNDPWFLKDVLNDLHSFWRDSRRRARERLELPLGHWWGPAIYTQGCPSPFDMHTFEFDREGGVEELIGRRGGPEEGTVGRWFSLVHRGWDPLGVPWVQFEEEARLIFDHCLRRYELEMRGFMESRGYRRIRTKREVWHYRALVGWVVQRREWWELERDFDRNFKTVQDGVTAAAHDARIVLPEGRPGKRAKRTPE